MVAVEAYNSRAGDDGLDSILLQEEDSTNGHVNRATVAIERAERERAGMLLNVHVVVHAVV